MSVLEIKSLEDVYIRAKNYFANDIPTYYTERFRTLLEVILLDLLNLESIYITYTNVGLKEIINITPPTKKKNCFYIQESLLAQYINYPITLEENYNTISDSFDFNSVFDNTDVLNNENNDLFCFQRYQPKYREFTKPIISDKIHIQLLLIVRVILVVLHFKKHLATKTHFSLSHAGNRDKFSLPTLSSKNYNNDDDDNDNDDDDDDDYTNDN